MYTLDYQPFDQEIWEKELDDFIPDRVYDMHTHMWSEKHKGNLVGPPSGLRLDIDYQDHLSWANKLYPGREMHYLILGTPIIGMDIESHNVWMAEELKADPESAINMIVTPDMTPEYVANQVKKYNFLGLKPYRIFAPDMTHCRIHEFLPESLIEVADDLGLAITMHLSKPTGPADPDNQKDLAYYTKRYPRAQWILAHCARAFNAFMMEEAIHFLTDLPNIWYDTSAVNDLYSHFLLMKHEDRSRVMFGSDNIAAGCARGKYITYGRAWTYYEGTTETTPHCDPRATLVVYEQLRQEKQVAEMLNLSPLEIEDHFSGNARRFLGQMRKNRKV
jgi:hypothetical protein